MGANSKIEWTDHTFSPWTGCTKVSPACDHCYAEGWAKRSGHVKWGSGQPRRRTSDANWRMPLKWNREAERTGVRPRVFCASLADVFDNEVDPAWRADLFKLIADTPNLDWLLLTKRIGNARRMIGEALTIMSEAGKPMNRWPWPNVWLGATVVNQEEADRDIPKLLAVPAAKRFLSIEPMLGPMNLNLPTRTWVNSRGDATCDHCCNGDRCDDPTHFSRGRPDFAPHCRCPYCRGTGNGKPLDWIIAGSESGSGACRDPNMVSWVASLRDQCVNAGVAFLWKQDVIDGKKIGAPQLEGQSWQQFPL